MFRIASITSECLFPVSSAISRLVIVLLMLAKLVIPAPPILPLPRTWRKWPQWPRPRLPWEPPRPLGGGSSLGGWLCQGPALSPCAPSPHPSASPAQIPSEMKILPPCCSFLG